MEELAKEQKLVIIVDELDRCRPDYALDMLEVMKHFFKVEGVHFILGVNLKQLANSVRARYGEAVEGERYLQKFISITMPLVPPIRQHYGSAHIPIQHFRQVSGQLGLTKSWKFGRLEYYLGFVDHHLGLSLRDVEKIATLAMITPDNVVNSKMGHALQASLLIIKVLAPETLEKARLGQMTRDDLLAIFQLQNPPEQDAADEEKVLFDVWSLIVHPHDQKMTPGQSDQVNDYFRGEKPREYLRDLIAKSLDVFQLPMKTSTAS
ncbi:MAG: P-loop NTPase fold protein [Hyphomicrobiales bacterium]